MISAASALSGFDLPARRSKNRSQSQKCVLRVFLRASASPRQEASLNPPPNPESRQHKIFFLPPNPIHPNHLSAPPPSPPPPHPSPPPPTPGHAKKKFSPSPLPPPPQPPYPPHPPPPPRQFHPPQPYHGT